MQTLFSSVAPARRAPSLSHTLGTSSARFAAEIRKDTTLDGVIHAAPMTGTSPTIFCTSLNDLHTSTSAMQFEVQLANGNVPPNVAAEVPQGAVTERVVGVVRQFGAVGTNIPDFDVTICDHAMSGVSIERQVADLLANWGKRDPPTPAGTRGSVRGQKRKRHRVSAALDLQ